MYTTTTASFRATRVLLDRNNFSVQHYTYFDI